MDTADQFEVSAINEQRQPAHRAIMQRAKVVLRDYEHLLTPSTEYIKVGKLQQTALRCSSSR